MNLEIERTIEAGAPPLAERILGADGILATGLPGYEARRPQIDMADLVEETLRGGGNVLVEAGTGCGKSFAYLVPAIYSGKKVVVSTETIQLQEQLYRKDLPFLSRMLEADLGRPVKFAIAKGRGNYFCKRNVREQLEAEAVSGKPGYSAALMLTALRQFDAGDWSGDKSDLKLQVNDGAWSEMSGDDTCTGRKCPHAGSCPYLAAKEKVEDADIVVTNHHMYLLHHYLPVALLPEHSVWIADEAHTLADKAGDVWGIEVRQGRPVGFAKTVLRQVRALGLELPLNSEELARWKQANRQPKPEEIWIDPERVREAADPFFAVWHGATSQEQRIDAFPPEILAEAEFRLGELVAELEPVREKLSRACRRLDPERDKETLWGVEALDQSCLELIGSLRAMLDPEKDAEYVRYVEIGVDNRGRKTATLQRKPIETAPIFREQVLPTLTAAVFCSATLATGKGPLAFKTTADDLGLSLVDTETLQAKSPFDYARQVFGYFPNTVPEARHPAYHTAAAEEIIRVLNYTQGRAFVLFTSTRDMRTVYELVRSRVRFPVLLQGEMPKDLLIEEFRREEGSVLFGVKTFWTGVDIQGDALSCVILVKLPFPVPSHPLVQARCERIKARGGSDFMEYSLPRCIRDVLQGFGRLIRSKRDEGVFVILDNRMHTARYARNIANALPDFPIAERL